MDNKRTKIGQKIHDDKLIKRVKINENLGFKVLADLPSRDKPQKINSFIPDLLAFRNGKLQKIEEIETLATAQLDRDQHTAFRLKAKQLGISYKTIIARRKRS